MVYDRFVHACARCVREGEGVEDVWAAWQAIELRCRPAVRTAANELAGYTLAIGDPHDSGSFYRHIMNLEFTAADLPWGSGPDHGSPDRPTEGEVMVSAIVTFTRSARADLNRRWWNTPAWSWRDLKAWREERREKREQAKRRKDRMQAYEATVARAVACGESDDQA